MKGSHMNTPREFSKKEPFDSALQNSESETVARNVMTILARTGNTWRVLSWDEYKAERLKDGSFTEGEKKYFDRVAGFCSNEAAALSFCPGWLS
jgi:hypothetical protein